VINKIDRPGVEPEKVMDPVFDLFVSLGASDHQLDFPVIYASGREGFAIREHHRRAQGPVAAARHDHREGAAARVGDPTGPLCMQVATLDYDDFLGYMAIGRMRAGSAKVGDRVLLAHRDGSKEEFRIQKVLGFQGLKRFELAVASAGDVCAITGMSELNVGETITSIQQPDDPAAAQDRRADDLDELPGQRRPVRRQGRQVRHQPQHARAPVPRDQEQRRPAGRGHRRGQRVQGVGPRRAAPVGA
jgi:predicted membrane GTPase involved in stress response